MIRNHRSLTDTVHDIATCSFLDRYPFGGNDSLLNSIVGGIPFSPSSFHILLNGLIIRRTAPLRRVGCGSGSQMLPAAASGFGRGGSIGALLFRAEGMATVLRITMPRCNSIAFGVGLPFWAMASSDRLA